MFKYIFIKNVSESKCKKLQIKNIFKNVSSTGHGVASL
jgi:hypothetical protein